MIRFKITGAGFLELKSGTKIDFQYNNSTLAIGNVKLSRSTEFLIPKTPSNEALLLFSSNIAGSGLMMRRKIQAEAHHSSGGYIKGYLSIKSYSKNEYSAIFVYGELEALKKTLELGNISTYVVTSEQLATSTGRSTTSALNASGILLNNFDFYRYVSDVPSGSRFDTTVNMSPTVKLRYLLGICASATGINLDASFNSNAINSMGILLKSQAPGKDYLNLLVEYSPDFVNFAFSGTASGLFSEVEINQVVNNEYLTKIKALKAQKDVTLYFQDDVDYGVLTINSKIVSYNYDDLMKIDAGSKFDLKTGDYFYFSHSDNYYFGILKAPFTQLNNVSCYVYKTVVSPEITLGTPFVLKDNLPEVTFNDLLKTVAGVMLSGLGFDEATNTLSLFDFNYDKANSIEIDGMLIEIESVDRTFMDYCQKNEIRFKSEDYVSNDSSIVYSIDNSNLGEKKLIYTIPLNDGIKSENNAYIKDFQYQNGWKKTAKNDSLVVASKAFENLEHISRIYENFPTILNSKLKAIIENSTTVKVKLKMYLYQFLAINYRTTLKYRGIHYTIYEASFSGGIVSATLVVV